MGLQLGLQLLKNESGEQERGELIRLEQCVEYAGHGTDLYKEKVSDKAGPVLNPGGMASSSLPGHGRNALAARRHRRANRAGMARPRIPRHDPEIPGALERNRTPARINEASVLSHLKYGLDLRRRSVARFCTVQHTQVRLPPIPRKNICVSCSVWV